MGETRAGKEPRQCSEVREPRGADLRLEELQGQNPRREEATGSMEEAQRAWGGEVGKWEQRAGKVAPAGGCGLWIIRDVQWSS